MTSGATVIVKADQQLSVATMLFTLAGGTFKAQETVTVAGQVIKGAMLSDTVIV